MKFHHRMFSRRLILGTAAVLAVTGATGAAAVLAPSDLGLSRLIPAVTAQTFTPTSNNDLLSQLPFDRVAQAPDTTPSPTLTDAPTASTPAPTASAPSAPAPLARAPATRTASAPPPATRTPASRAPAVRDPAAQAPSARAPIAQAPGGQAPIGQGPVAQSPLPQTPIAAPQGRMVVTSGPGVVVQHHAQTRRVYRPRYVSNDYCAE
jgi:hypothetical protein